MSNFDIVDCPLLGYGYITKDTSEVHTSHVRIKDRRLYQDEGDGYVDLNWKGDLYFWYNGLDVDEHWFAFFVNGNLTKLELLTREEAGKRVEGNNYSKD
jgi:hypothetical protein